MARIGPPAASRPPVTTGAPHLRGAWDAGRMTAAIVVALLPPLALALYQSAAALLPLMILSIVVVLGWQAVFAYLRGRALKADGIVTAITFALLLPPAAPTWQVAIGLSFGVVVGEQVFGGRGRNFLNPTVVALAFLIFSFPGAGYDQGGAASALASLPGGLLLIAAGLISWRVVAAAAVGLVAAAYLLGTADPIGQLMVGGFVFGLIFLACDPVTAAATNPGRWIVGLMVGGLVPLGRAAGGDGVVFAILIATIFAPLIDRGVVAVDARLRRWRYG